MRSLLKLLVSSLIFVILLTACQPATGQPAVEEPAVSQPTGETTTLNVFAAASLLQPFEEMSKPFEALNPGIRLVINTANSSQLAEQIMQGAPADVFASAAEPFMARVVESGQVAEGDVVLFARNQLVVIFPKDNPAGVRTLQDLARPGMKLVMGAREGPQGIYVEQFLVNASQDDRFPADFKEAVYRNVVSYESTVNGVVTKVSLGEADAGFVYYSDAQGSAIEKVSYLEIPGEINIEARYPMAALAESPNYELAKAFVRFVLSPEGQDILGKYGFLSP